MKVNSIIGIVAMLLMLSAIFAANHEIKRAKAESLKFQQEEAECSLVSKSMIEMMQEMDNQYSICKDQLGVCRGD